MVDGRALKKIDKPVFDPLRRLSFDQLLDLRPAEAPVARSKRFHAAAIPYFGRRLEGRRTGLAPAPLGGDSASRRLAVLEGGLPRLPEARQRVAAQPPTVCRLPRTWTTSGVSNNDICGCVPLRLRTASMMVRGSMRS